MTERADTDGTAVNHAANSSRPRRSGFVRMTLFLLLVAVLELGYGLYNPPLHNPDELSHLQNAAWWRDEGTWADPYSEAERIQQDHHPPYTGILGGIVLKLTEGVFEDSAPLRLPGPYEVTLDFGREERVRAADDKAKARIGQLYVLRFVIALHQLLLAFFLLRCVDFVWPDRRRFAFGIALACCAIPQVAMNGAALTPDTPLAAFSTAALYYVLRAASGQGSARRLGLAAGCFFALALWCKSGAIFLIPTTCVAALVRASALRSLRAGLTWLLWCALPPLVFGSYWYARNLYLHGDPFHMHVLVETYTFAMRREPATAAFVEVTFWDIFRTFFGFWNRAILLPRPLLLAIAGACGAATLGVLLLLRRSVRSELPREALHAIAPSFVALATLLALTVMGNFSFPSAQGRYLYPALAGFAVLFGSGLRIALRLRGDSRLVYLGVAAWIGIGYLGFDYAVLSKFYASRARAQGEGAVVFYEDCGTEGLHPHLVPGTGLTPPDEGMLGRVVPWRTISAHPVAVVYRFEVPRDVDVNDLQVRLTYYNPDPSTPFVAHERGHFVYPTQRLRANGVLLHDEVEITSQPKELVYPLPRSVFAGTRADGTRSEPTTEASRSLELRFEKTAGIAACVAEIWVERRWVVASSEATSPMLHNRTQRQLEVVVIQGDGPRLEEKVFDLEPLARLPLSDLPRSVLLRDASPFMLREAEAHKTTSSRWFGHKEASGGYFVRGTGTLAQLPFIGEVLGQPAATLRARTLEPGTRSWAMVAVDPAQVVDGYLVFRSESSADLDYVLLSGGLRPGF